MFIKRKKVYKRAELEPAIARMGMALDAVRNIARIARKEGRTRTADFNAKNAESFRVGQKVMRDAISE